MSLAHATSRARLLRQQHNPAEAALWVALKNRQLGGYKFVRQFPIGPFIADFACRSMRLVIEVDGSQHIDSLHDRRRDAFMARLGYGVMRIPSVTVLSRRGDVCDTILAVLKGQLKESVVTLDLTYVPPLT